MRGKSSALPLDSTKNASRKARAARRVGRYMVVSGRVSGSGFSPLGSGRSPESMARARVVRNGAEGGMV